MDPANIFLRAAQTTNSDEEKQTYSTSINDVSTKTKTFAYMKRKHDDNNANSNKSTTSKTSSNSKVTTTTKSTLKEKFPIPEFSSGLLEATTQLRGVVPISRNFRLKSNQKNNNKDLTQLILLANKTNNMQQQHQHSRLSSNQTTLNFVNSGISYVSFTQNNNNFLVALQSFLSSHLRKRMEILFKNKQQQQQENDDGMFLLPHLSTFHRQKNQNQKNKQNLLPSCPGEEVKKFVLELNNNLMTTNESHENSKNSNISANISTHSHHQQQYNSNKKQQFFPSSHKVETLYLSNNHSLGHFIITKNSEEENENEELDGSILNNKNNLLFFTTTTFSASSSSSLLGLLQFPNLKKLSLTHCGIRHISFLSPLRFLPNLEHLNLEGNPICDFSLMYRNHVIAFFSHCGCCCCSTYSTSNSTSSSANSNAFTENLFHNNNSNQAVSHSSPSSTKHTTTTKRKASSSLKSLDGKQITTSEVEKSTSDYITNFSSTRLKKLRILFQRSTMLQTVAMQMSLNSEFKEKYYHHNFKNNNKFSMTSSSSSQQRKYLRLLLLLSILSRAPLLRSSFFDAPEFEPCLLCGNETSDTLLVTKISSTLQKQCVAFAMKKSKRQQIVGKLPNWEEAMDELEENFEIEIDESIVVLLNCCSFSSGNSSGNKQQIEFQQREEILKPFQNVVAKFCSVFPQNKIVLKQQRENNNNNTEMKFICGFPSLLSASSWNVADSETDNVCSQQDELFLQGVNSSIFYPSSSTTGKIKSSSPKEELSSISKMILNVATVFQETMRMLMMEKKEREEEKNQQEEIAQQQQHQFFVENDENDFEENENFVEEEDGDDAGLFLTDESHSPYRNHFFFSEEKEENNKQNKQNNNHNNKSASVSSERPSAMIGRESVENETNNNNGNNIFVDDDLQEKEVVEEEQQEDEINFLNETDENIFEQEQQNLEREKVQQQQQKLFDENENDVDESSFNEIADDFYNSGLLNRTFSSWLYRTQRILDQENEFVTVFKQLQIFNKKQNIFQFWKEKACFSEKERNLICSRGNNNNKNENKNDPRLLLQKLHLVEAKEKENEEEHQQQQQQIIQQKQNVEIFADSYYQKNVLLKSFFGKWKSKFSEKRANRIFEENYCVYNNDLSSDEDVENLSKMLKNQKRSKYLILLKLSSLFTTNNNKNHNNNNVNSIVDKLHKEDEIRKLVLQKWKNKLLLLLSCKKSNVVAAENSRNLDFEQERENQNENQHVFTNNNTINSCEVSAISIISDREEEVEQLNQRSQRLEETNNSTIKRNSTKNLVLRRARRRCWKALVRTAQSQNLKERVKTLIEEEKLQEENKNKEKEYFFSPEPRLPTTNKTTTTKSQKQHQQQLHSISTTTNSTEEILASNMLDIPDDIIELASQCLDESLDRDVVALTNLQEEMNEKNIVEEEEFEPLPLNRNDNKFNNNNNNKHHKNDDINLYDDDDLEEFLLAPPAQNNNHTTSSSQQQPNNNNNRHHNFNFVPSSTSTTATSSTLQSCDISDITVPTNNNDQDQEEEIHQHQRKIKQTRKTREVSSVNSSLNNILNNNNNEGDEEEVTGKIKNKNREHNNNTNSSSHSKNNKNKNKNQLRNIDVVQSFHKLVESLAKFPENALS